MREIPAQHRQRMQIPRPPLPKEVARYGIVVGLLILLFIWNPIPATGKPLGILVFTVLALIGAYILIQQTAVEFPDARSGAATHTIRTRMASMRERRHQRAEPS